MYTEDVKNELKQVTVHHLQPRIAPDGTSVSHAVDESVDIDFIGNGDREAMSYDVLTSARLSNSQAHSLS